MISITDKIPEAELTHIANIENLLDFCHDTLSKYSLDYKNIRLKKMYIYLAFGDIFTKCSAMVTLLKESKTISCNLILRGLIELFLNIEYVLADRSNNNLFQFYIDDNDERMKLANKTKDFLVRNPNQKYFGGQEDTPKHWDLYKIKIEKESLKLKRRARNLNIKPLPNLKDRVMYVDKIRKTKLEWWYINLYWLFSLDTHGSTRGLEKHLVTRNGELFFELEGDISDIEKEAVTTYMILYCVTERFFTMFNLPKQQLVDYKRIFKTYVKRPLATGAAI